MDITILGSGTSIPLEDRSAPSLAVILEKKPILFDMGPGSLRRLTKAGLSFERLQQIFITHFHPDHTADLIHYLFATKLPSILKKREPFSIIGPKGLKRLIQRLQEAYEPWLDMPAGMMEIEEIDIGKKSQKEYEGFRIISAPTLHTPQSLAYRFETSSGKSFVYSGDTGYCHEIIELSQGTDLLVLECSFPDGQAVEGHLTPSQAGEIASLAHVRQLVLTHFYPECLGTDIENQCRKAYKGTLILATDLLRLQI